MIGLFLGFLGRDNLLSSPSCRQTGGSSPPSCSRHCKSSLKSTYSPEAAALANCGGMAETEPLKGASCRRAGVEEGPGCGGGGTWLWEGRGGRGSHLWGGGIWLGGEGRLQCQRSGGGGLEHPRGEGSGRGDWVWLRVGGEWFPGSEAAAGQEDRGGEGCGGGGNGGAVVAGAGAVVALRPSCWRTCATACCTAICTMHDGEGVVAGGARLVAVAWVVPLVVAVGGGGGGGGGGSGVPEAVEAGGLLVASHRGGSWARRTRRRAMSCAFSPDDGRPASRQSSTRRDFSCAARSSAQRSVRLDIATMI